MICEYASYFNPAIVFEQKCSAFKVSQFHFLRSWTKQGSLEAARLWPCRCSREAQNSSDGEQQLRFCCLHDCVSWLMFLDVPCVCRAHPELVGIGRRFFIAVRHVFSILTPKIRRVVSVKKSKVVRCPNSAEKGRGEWGSLCLPSVETSMSPILVTRLFNAVASIRTPMELKALFTTMSMVNPCPSLTGSHVWRVQERQVADMGQIKWRSCVRWP